MSSLHDPEFGEVALRRSRLARAVRLKLDARGVISLSLPMRAPVFIARQLLDESRDHVRQLLAGIQAKRRPYHHGDLIGKTHTLRFEPAGEYGHRLEQNALIISHPLATQPQKLNQTITDGISKALRMQARSYLPRRLQQLAEITGFTYQKVRFSSAGTRWGSCSSQGTISLNIWLMQLPFELIDYVLIHELCHTRQMNHSTAFWSLVERYCSDYRTRRRQLRGHHPHA